MKLLAVLLLVLLGLLSNLCLLKLIDNTNKLSGAKLHSLLVLLVFFSKKVSETQFSLFAVFIFWIVGEGQRIGNVALTETEIT